MHKIVSDARDFAKEAHGDQLYGKDKPYIYHLDKVAEIVAPYGPIAQILAYLHDMVEDTHINFYSIYKKYNMYIAKCVDFLTDIDGPNRKRRKEKINKRFQTIDLFDKYYIVLIIKAADRLANMRECGKIDMYLKEHKEFKKAVYREGLAEEIWEEIDKIKDAAK